MILDKDSLKKKDVIKVAEEVLRGGADVIQYRDKTSSDKAFIKEAMALKEIIKRHGRTFIINDRIDAARAVGADGVHLGQEDMPIRYAREIIGNKIIGVSAHSLEEALRAEKDGADYIGIGPIFKSPSKPGLKPIGPAVLKNIKKSAGIPFFAIGGINLKNIADLKKMGINKIAVISAAIANGDICKSVSHLKHELENKSKAK